MYAGLGDRGEIQVRTGNNVRHGGVRVRDHGGNDVNRDSSGREETHEKVPAGTQEIERSKGEVLYGR